MRIRPIQPDELSVFAGAATRSEHVATVHDYVSDLLIKGSMRTEWCYVAESRRRAIGRAAFWTLPKMSYPLDLVFLDVPWETEGAYEIGVSLLQVMFRAARLLDVDELGHVMDSPGQWPQWQFHEGQRAALLESQGFRVDREMHRFEFHMGEAELPSFDERGLVFRSLIEVGEEAFKAAVFRVSEGSLDRRRLVKRQQLGPEAETQDTFGQLKSMEYDPAWWELAFTTDDRLAGLVMPMGAPSAATIGYIGVAPEMRGKGYGEVLLVRGTATLLKTGAPIVRGETDVVNRPMAKVFRSVGYRQFATRREFKVSLAT
jgi:ribosomal protein S18 acetylase RimI-like enzyme